MPTLLLGFSFLIFGGVSVWDARRIASTTRLRGTLDLIGPDGYLHGIAILLLVTGTLLLVQGAYQWWQKRAGAGASTTAVPVPAPTPAASGVAADVEGGANTIRHLTLIGALMGYAILLPIAGYAVTTIAFLMAVFRIMGMTSIARNIAWSLGVATVFYIGFVVIADLPLPAGLLRIG